MDVLMLQCFFYVLLATQLVQSEIPSTVNSQCWLDSQRFVETADSKSSSAEQRVYQLVGNRRMQVQ